ncbi:MAG TPA: sulfite oxidase [Dehalococcoidia bacterium]|nr:sulfite oxidase [Dehalococcoidia bacterium]
MALFVVRHQHDAARCPAQDPSAGAMLLNHLSRPNVRRHGIRIQAEAIAQEQHQLYMVVEAEEIGRVRAFMAPFEQAGTVEILPASTCVRAVASGGCAAVLPSSEDAPAVDPEEACQDAIDAGLVVHRAHPLNGETAIPALLGSVVMPNAHFYVRNHFHIPALDPADWRLQVGGLVDEPLRLSLADLRAMRSQTLVATLECAGNGRTLYEPPIDGEQWDLGAVSTAEWTGVPLVEVLDRARPRASAQTVLFRGADQGAVDGATRAIAFERSLSLDDARGSGALLAYAMNGEPLPLQHGFPLRVIVPSWYAVASVKWLAAIELLEQPFAGHFQTEKYIFEREADGRILHEPVTLQRVRALITTPQPNERVETGLLTVRGVAWSGAAPIGRVELRVGDGAWQEAQLLGERRRHCWQWWELRTRVEAPGPITLRARATDLAGRTQPERAEWNRLGYGNNQVHAVPIDVV